MNVKELLNSLNNLVEYVKFLESTLDMLCKNTKNVDIWKDIYEILLDVEPHIQSKFMFKLEENEEQDLLIKLYEIILEESTKALKDIFEDSLEDIIASKDVDDYEDARYNLKVEFDDSLDQIKIIRSKDKIYYDNVDKLKNLLKEADIDYEIRKYGDNTLKWFLKKINYGGTI